MPKTLIKVDLNQCPDNQPTPLHNRWHPDIPAVSAVEPGEAFRVECMDCLGGQIKKTESVEDVLNVDLSGVHYLSGPIEVKGAEPGDLLVVDILDIGALPGSEWGFTCILTKELGGGFLMDHFPNKAVKAIWNFEGRFATSKQIPGVRLASHIHPGIIACAPSHELLKKWNEREKLLVNTEPNSHAMLPLAQGALLGKLHGSQAERVANEAARTIPPREHGGNCDIKNISIGSRIFLPVYVHGANLSMGDIHFSQGDGEITFCGAIEMAGYIDMKVSLIKGGVDQYAVKNPIFSSATFLPNYSDYLTFEGISVDDNGKQHYMDSNLAYKQACLNAINYLEKFGFTREQAYLILSAAPIEGRMSSLVDIPNACCTLAIPTQVFDFDIKPKLNVNKINIVD